MALQTRVLCLDCGEWFETLSTAMWPEHVGCVPVENARPQYEARNVAPDAIPTGGMLFPHGDQPDPIHVRAWTPEPPITEDDLKKFGKVFSSGEATHLRDDVTPADRQRGRSSHERMRDFVDNVPVNDPGAKP